MFYKCILFLFIISCSTALNAKDNKVNFNDLRILHFKKNSLTNRKRNLATNQLNCKGKSCYKYQPLSVTCYNKAFSSYNPVWKCKSKDLPKEIKFEDVNIICEGYGDPKDSYILKGSCSLEYSLKLTKPTSKFKRFTFLSLIIIVISSYLQNKSTINLMEPQ